VKQALGAAACEISEAGGLACGRRRCTKPLIAQLQGWWGGTNARIGAIWVCAKGEFGDAGAGLVISPRIRRADSVRTCARNIFYMGDCFGVGGRDLGCHRRSMNDGGKCPAGWILWWPDAESLNGCAARKGIDRAGGRPWGWRRLKRSCFLRDFHEDFEEGFIRAFLKRRRPVYSYGRWDRRA